MNVWRNDKNIAHHDGSTRAQTNAHGGTWKKFHHFLNAQTSFCNKCHVYIHQHLCLQTPLRSCIDLATTKSPKKLQFFPVFWNLCQMAISFATSGPKKYSSYDIGSLNTQLFARLILQGGFVPETMVVNQLTQAHFKNVVLVPPQYKPFGPHVYRYLVITPSAHPITLYTNLYRIIQCRNPTSSLIPFFSSSPCSHLFTLPQPPPTPHSISNNVNHCNSNLWSMFLLKSPPFSTLNIFTRCTASSL